MTVSILSRLSPYRLRAMAAARRRLAVYRLRRDDFAGWVEMKDAAIRLEEQAARMERGEAAP